MSRIRIKVSNLKHKHHFQILHPQTSHSNSTHNYPTSHSLPHSLTFSPTTSQTPSSPLQKLQIRHSPLILLPIHRKPTRVPLRHPLFRSTTTFLPPLTQLLIYLRLVASPFDVCCFAFVVLAMGVGGVVFGGTVFASLWGIGGGWRWLEVV